MLKLWNAYILMFGAYNVYFSPHYLSGHLLKSSLPVYYCGAYLFMYHQCPSYTEQNRTEQNRTEQNRKKKDWQTCTSCPTFCTCLSVWFSLFCVWCSVCLSVCLCLCLCLCLSRLLFRLLVSLLVPLACPVCLSNLYAHTPHSPSPPSEWVSL